MVGKHFTELHGQSLDISHHLLQTMSIFKGLHFKLCVCACLRMGMFMCVYTSSRGGWYLMILLELELQVIDHEATPVYMVETGHWPWEGKSSKWS